MSARIFAIIELSHFVNTRHTIYSIKKNQTTRRKIIYDFKENKNDI